MPPPPFISVIVATAFRERMLLECVESVVKQGYSQFEILVIDQAPEPSLQAMLRERFRDAAVTYFHLPSAGAARARNYGVVHASGAVVAFLDDDAIAEPDWLSAIAAGLADPSRPALLAGRILPAWEEARPKWYPKQQEFLLGLYDAGDERHPLPDTDQPIAANMAGWRQIILDHGGFEESLGPNYFHKHKMVTGEETILARRIRASGGRIVYEPAVSVRHRVTARKQTRRYFLRRSFWEGVTTIRQMELLGITGPERWRARLGYVAESCRAAARFLLPRYADWYDDSTAAIRILALGRLSHAIGALYALVSVPPNHTGPDEAK